MFMIAGIAILIALVPILLTVSPAPSYIQPQKISFRELYYTSPLGTVGFFICGVSMGAYFGFVFLRHRIFFRPALFFTFIANQRLPVAWTACERFIQINPPQWPGRILETVSFRRRH